MFILEQFIAGESATVCKLLPWQPWLHPSCGPNLYRNLITVCKFRPTASRMLSRQLPVCTHNSRAFSEWYPSRFMHCLHSQVQPNFLSSDLTFVTSR